MNNTICLKHITLISACSISLFSCVPVLIGLGAEAGYVASQEERSIEEVLTDQYLVSAIKTKLLADSIVPGMDINVDSVKAVITLSGTLSSREQIDRAVEIADETDGVISVISKLRLEGW